MQMSRGSVLNCDHRDQTLRPRDGHSSNKTSALIQHNTMFDLKRVNSKTTCSLFLNVLSQKQKAMFEFKHRNSKMKYDF